MDRRSFIKKMGFFSIATMMPARTGLPVAKYMAQQNSIAPLSPAPPMDAINAADYGYGSATPAQTAINRAIMAAVGRSKAVLIPKTAGQKITGSIVMHRGITVYCQDALTACIELAVLVDFSNVSNAAWYGGMLNGDTTTNSQIGFLLANANGNTLLGFILSGVRNKGVDISAQSGKGMISRNNTISPISISGCVGPTGAGLSIFGDGAHNNQINGGWFNSNRIGITVNGAHHNTFSNCIANNNRAIGIAIDGIITDAGDGGRFNTFTSVTANGNGTQDSHYAGIYLGNGSSDNQFDSPACNNNKGAGVYSTGENGFEPKSNVFNSAHCEGNAGHGMNFSTSPDTRVTAPVLLNNGTHGIQFYKSDGSSLTGGVSNCNKEDGVLLQSGKCSIQNLIATNNGSHGVEIAFGGSSLTNNTISGCRLTGNIGTGLVEEPGTTVISTSY